MVEAEDETVSGQLRRRPPGAGAELRAQAPTPFVIGKQCRWAMDGVPLEIAELQILPELP